MVALDPKIKFDSKVVQLQPLLQNMVEIASRPLEEAQSFPAEYYRSEALYALEVERIFHKEWLYVCRTDQVAEPGDWYKADIAGEAITVVRGDDDEIRALSRVCPHRLMDVLGDQESREGKAETFVCPYHSWSFKLDGSLSGAPLIAGSSLFRRERDEYCLTEFRTEIWHGFVFVNFDGNAEPLGPRLVELSDELRPYRMDEWRVMDTVDWPEAEVSWKVVMDNGLECYHHHGAHLLTAEPGWPSSLVETDPCNSEYFYWNRLPIDPASAVGEEDGHLLQATVLPPLDNLSAYQRSYSMLAGIWPTMWFLPSADLMLIAKWWPTGPSSHKFFIDVLVHQDQLNNPDVATAVADGKEFARLLQVEDAMICVATQKMLGSTAAADGGALAPLEKAIWQFQRFVVNRLAGANL